MPSGFTVGVFLFLGIGLCLFKANIAQAGLADHVVINEVQISSGPGDGQYDDWVELYNPTASDVILDNWSIQKTNATGVSLYRKALLGTISAGGYFLIVRGHASTTQALKDVADVLAAGSSFSLTDNNVVYLVSNNIDIATSTDPNTDPNIVDFVGFGTTNIHEGTAAASAILGIPDGKSIARVPNGEDTNQNSVDFVVQDTPTPQNSRENTNDIIDGSVVLTITPDTTPAQNITPFNAQIVFQVNSTSTVKINYGLSSAYGSSTATSAVSANTLSSITLADLQCNRTYHYSIYAENSGATGTDQTSDKTFSTIPCNSISLNFLTMPKTAARADNNYLDGWEWQFNITIWNMNETSLKMKFYRWNGTSTLDAANNMQFSVDNGLSWSNITANGVYPIAGVNISGIDNSTDPGRQVKIIVQMKVPVGTLAGIYNSNYGILTQ